MGVGLAAALDALSLLLVTAFIGARDVGLVVALVLSSFQLCVLMHVFAIAGLSGTGTGAPAEPLSLAESVQTVCTYTRKAANGVRTGRLNRCQGTPESLPKGWPSTALVLKAQGFCCIDELLCFWYTQDSRHQHHVIVDDLWPKLLWRQPDWWQLCCLLLNLRRWGLLLLLLQLQHLLLFLLAWFAHSCNNQHTMPWPAV